MCAPVYETAKEERERGREGEREKSFKFLSTLRRLSNLAKADAHEGKDEIKARRDGDAGPLVELLDP
jgi:hypothetical protein